MQQIHKTTILFLSADPSDQARLRLGEEQREIHNKLQLAKLRESFIFEVRSSVRPGDVVQALLDTKPWIVHFSGHGTNTGDICLENEFGEIQPVKPEALAALFELVMNFVECVILNACYSESQAKMIGRYINYVIGMNQAIGDKAAISFSVGFYRALGAGRPIEDAFKFGVVELRMMNIPEYFTPILIKKRKSSRKASEASKVSSAIKNYHQHSETLLTILLEKEIDSFTLFEQEILVFAISRLVEIPPEHIRILRVSPGSVNVMIGLPLHPAKQLIDLFNKRDPRLNNLKIVNVSLNSEGKDTSNTKSIFNPVRVNIDEMLIYLGKLILEFLGRNRTAPRYPFRDHEIATAGFRKKVSPVWQAFYLHLHPTHYAVATGPDGRIMHLRGGYNRLSPGHYILHYVDKGNRVTRIPRTTETTFDGFQVSLELVVTYRVIDPIKALEVQQAVETLIIFIQSDLKEFIRSHKYNEIVGDQDGGRIDNELLTRYIREQHATRHQMSKLFLMADVVVEEKIGDPRVNEIRDKFQLNQREFNAQSEMERQNRELKKTVAEQEAAIQHVQAEAEVRQQEILRTVKLQQIELDNARQQFQARQDTYAQAIGAISQALSNQTYPRGTEELQIIKELFDTVKQSLSINETEGKEHKEKGRPPSEASISVNIGRINELTNSLLNLLNRKSS